MPVKKVDVAVIGGGMAGAMAAMTAARKGGRTLVITKGPGATALSSGAVDICTGPVVGPRVTWDRLLDVKSNISEMLLLHPCHPYGLLSMGSVPDPAAVVLEMIEEAIDFLARRLGEAGLILKGKVSTQVAVPTALGTWKLTSLFQSCQQAGALPTGSAVLGIRNLAFPDACFLAGMLQATLEAKGMGAGETIDCIEIEFGDDRSWTPPELSEYLSGPGRWDSFISAIEKGGGGRYGLLLLPPIVPYEVASTSELILNGGTLLREIAGLPINAPGKRLDAALGKASEASGVEELAGEVLDFEQAEDELGSCIVKSDGDEIEVNARAWVLTTGKFIGGGLQKGKAFRESLLDLPVFCDGEPVGEIWTKKLLGASVLDRHDAFSVGILADASLRPVDAYGRVIYKNLFAAGSVLGGYNYHYDGCGLGVCVLTGRVAGANAAD